MSKESTVVDINDNLFKKAMSHFPEIHMEEFEGLEFHILQYDEEFYTLTLAYYYKISDKDKSGFIQNTGVSGDSIDEVMEKLEALLNIGFFSGIQDINPTGHVFKIVDEGMAHIATIDLSEMIQVSEID